MLRQLKRTFASDTYEFLKCVFYVSNTCLGMAGVVNMVVSSSILSKASSEDGSALDGGIYNTGLRSIVVGYRRYFGYTALFLGMVQIAVSVFGCMGPIKESSYMLKTYWLIAILLAVWNFIIICIVAHLLKQINTEMDSLLKESMKKYNGKGNFVTFYFDLMQVKMECCGLTGHRDYLDTEWFRGGGTGVPASCCTLRNEKRRYEYSLWHAEYRPLRSEDLLIPACMPFPSLKAHTNVPCMEKMKEDSKKHLVFALVFSILSMPCQGFLAVVARKIEIILLYDEEEEDD